MRPIKLRTETLTILHVTYDRTTGSPNSREAQGDGDPIVAVEVTLHQGGWRINQLQGQGGQDFCLKKKEGYANAESRSNSPSYTQTR